MIAIAAVVLMAAPAQPIVPFDPVAFFGGRTHGEGDLKVLFQPPKRITVDGVGTVDKDGFLKLRQVIHEPGKKPRARLWKLKQTGPDRFEGTLTDADGPVRIELTRNVLHIRYRDKERLDFEQWLEPSSPRTLRNRTRIKRFGLTVARLEEVIRKLD